MRLSLKAEPRIAPIGPVTFHSLRRTYGSLGCACGDDIRYASTQLGHEDPRFSPRVYVQPTKRRERLSGPHRKGTSGRSIGHEWALTSPSSLRRFGENKATSPTQRSQARLQSER